MELEEFCDKYCPMTSKLQCRDGSTEIDCDIEESECPFNGGKDGKVLSCPDAIARILAQYVPKEDK